MSVDVLSIQGLKSITKEPSWIGDKMSLEKVTAFKNSFKPR